MRWTEAHLQQLTARVVGQTGKVGHAVPIVAKYRNKRTTVDDILFCSKLEARRYGELKLMEAAGQIRNLRVHTRWVLTLNGNHLCIYVDDFSYLNAAHENELIVEDAKGVRTPLYTLKKRLMRAIHGISITEIM